tara:strand:- start:1653 stop:2396 length:744 start_codon:yes stop_codon:yes gene_type:complete
MKWGYTQLVCPYESWDQTLVRKIFNEVVNIKKCGYGHNYKDVLPVETLDFISDHYLVWIENNGKREYISGMKGISLKKLKQYNLELPCISLLNSIKTVSSIKEHLDSLEIMISQYSDVEDKVNYFNGWTIKPEYRGRDESSQILKLASVACITFVQEELGFKRLGLGSGMPHLKTDKVFEEMGYASWQLHGEELPPLKSPSYNMRETLFMQGTSTPLVYLNKVDFLKKHWEDREMLGHINKIDKAAA